VPLLAGDAVLFTGFPGFLGARLLPRLLELRKDVAAVCLVQPRFAALAAEQIAGLEQSHAFLRGRIETVAGDLTEPGLGLEGEAARSLRERLVGCFHLAAVYDLAVSRELGMRVNVAGTRHVVDFLRGCPRFRKLDYVSTAYVSGTHRGRFLESDLALGQSFKNAYEETKYLAEKVVADSGLASTVYRPAVVVGDSQTGETAKFDGPYYVMTAMERLPSPGLFLRIGRGANPVNLVPVDFVVEAMARLSAWEDSAGRTYHLTDPSPRSAQEVARLLARALGKRFLFVPVPLWLAKAMMALPLVQKWLGLPAETLDYFDNPCVYDAGAATRDLSAFGLSCPLFEQYASVLVDFYRRKKTEVRREAMI